MGQILLEAVLYLLIAFFFYALPGLIARSRGHRNWRGILVLNLLLGWTVIGWVGSAHSSGLTQNLKATPLPLKVHAPRPHCSQMTSSIAALAETHSCCLTSCV